MIYTVTRVLEIAGVDRLIYVALDDNEPRIAEVGFTEQQAKARAQLTLEHLHKARPCMTKF